MRDMDSAVGQAEHGDAFLRYLEQMLKIPGAAGALPTSSGGLPIKNYLFYLTNGIGAARKLYKDIDRNAARRNIQHFSNCFEGAIQPDATFGQNWTMDVVGRNSALAKAGRHHLEAARPRQHRDDSGLPRSHSAAASGGGGEGEGVVERQAVRASGTSA